ncbi:MAG TPA: HAMP domain-containing protein [Armatimonadota bacterium]|jgi:HAMP domain-containing protein
MQKRGVCARSPLASGVGALRRRWAVASTQVRLTTLASLVMVAVVVPASYLTGSHATSLVRRETRLAMSNVAVTVLQSVAAQPGAPPAIWERLLNNLVSAKLVDEQYSVDVVYGLLQDQRGAVLAAAYDEHALVLTGNPGPETKRAAVQAALLALSADPEAAGRQGLIVVQASLESDRPMTLTLGCTRAAAERLISQLIARHVAVAALIIIAAILSLWVVLGRATRPLSEVFRAVNQVSRGSLHHPVVSRRPDEVGKVAQAVDQIRLALMRGRQWRALTLRLLETASLDPARLPVGLAYLLLPPPPGLSDATDSSWPQLIEQVMDLEGVVEGAVGERVVVSWGRAGAEQDDLLRAVVAGLEISGQLAAEGVPPVWPLVTRNLPAALAAARPLEGCTPSQSPAVWLLAADFETIADELTAGERVVVGEGDSGAWVVVTCRVDEDLS